MPYRNIFGLFSILGLTSLMGIKLATTTITSYISIPIGATNCNVEGYVMTSDECNAPLYLPNGSTITNVTLYYSDTSVDYAGIKLERTVFDGVNHNVFTITTEDGQSSTTLATNILIDNSQNGYWLRFLHPGYGGLSLYGAVVEYTIPVPLWPAAYLSMIKN